MARSETRWTLLLPGGIDHRYGESAHTYTRTTLPIAGWRGTVSGRRSAARVDGRTLGRRIRRAIENYSCAQSAIDGHVGVAQERTMRNWPQIECLRVRPRGGSVREN